MCGTYFIFLLSLWASCTPVFEGESLSILHSNWLVVCD